MYFEEIRVGMAVNIAPAHIEKQKMLDFARLYDNIPLHTDEEYAKTSPFGALIAPRFYLQCEGMQDYWINPKGAWMNFCGVKEAYRYLGCEDNCGAWFRPGIHRHKLPDFTEFLEFMSAKMQGSPTAAHLKINPYPELMIDTDWS